MLVLVYKCVLTSRYTYFGRNICNACAPHIPETSLWEGPSHPIYRPYKVSVTYLYF